MCYHAWDFVFPLLSQGLTLLPWLTCTHCADQAALELKRSTWPCLLLSAGWVHTIMPNSTTVILIRGRKECS